MTCRACKSAPSTGKVFALCVPCFVAFALKVEAHKAATGKSYQISDAEFEYVNEPWADRSKS